MRVKMAQQYMVDFWEKQERFQLKKS